MPAQAATRTGDVAALSLSGLCLVHCLALPALGVSLPLLGVWAEAEWVHWSFIALAVPISLWALSRGGRHGRARRIILAGVGLGLLVAGASEIGDETLMTVTGGLMLATAHLLNLRRHGGPGFPLPLPESRFKVQPSPRRRTSDPGRTPRRRRAGP